MACEYLRLGALFQKSTCELTKKELDNHTVTNVCNTWGKHTECADYKKAKGLCFITTAVCDTLGKPDDCYELESMRSFRDNWLKKQPGGDTEIQEYYNIAPQIVMAINALENANEIYSGICEKYIVPCVEFTNNGDDQSCHKIYRAMIDSLRQKYIPVGV
jgi:hypothetical protein